MIRRQRLIRDFLATGMLFAASAAAGLGLNGLRESTLPLIYEPPAAGFQRIALSDGWGDGIHTISLDDAKILVGERGALVLDARPDLFYEFGHIPGSHNLSRKKMDEDMEKLRVLLAEAHGQDVPLLIYCANLHCEDASVVAARLQSEGYPTTLIFEGGYDEWENSGLAVDTGS